MGFLAARLFSGETVEQRIARVGQTSGFDYLRLALALAVILWHSFHVTHEQADVVRMSSGYYRPMMAIVLPMFFALSGFLVAGSLVRTNSLVVFLTLRALRIFPALTVEILLSALILGPFVTTENLHAYFSGREFWNYFLNILGLIHYTLPGVYSGNIVPKLVNLSLWTIPFELECYIVISVLFAVGLTSRWKHLFLPMVLTAIVCLTLWSLRPAVMKVSGPVYGRALVLSFLLGVALYLYRERVVLNGFLAALAAVASIVLLSIPPLAPFSVVPAAYLTVYLGMLTPPRVWLIRTGDYSYGLYLFAFPLQQLYVYLMNNRAGMLANYAFSVVLCLGYAAFSWHCVEKPILSRKTMVIGFIQRALGHFARPANVPT